jgi:hypothetical protein
MNIYFELLLLALVVIYVVDLSGFSDTLLRWVNRWLRRYHYGPVENLRPFTCSLCMVWWCGLLWCIYRNNFTLPAVAYCAALSAFSFTLSTLVVFIRETALAVLRKMMDKWL